jgi:6-pyruvoyltetrahydropterin/6-carboxytetrahydropterin synthase
MVRITKEVTFDLCHQLLNHDGLCKNLHGHTYKLHVTLIGPTQGVAKEQFLGDGQRLEGANPAEGMVIDFKHLKQIIKDTVMDKYDHAFVGKGDEPILKHIIALGMKHAILGVRTTCEEMTPIIFNDIQEALLKLGYADVKVESVKLWETPTSFAEYKL